MTFQIDETKKDIVEWHAGDASFTMKPDGTITINGRTLTNDLALVEGFYEFFKLAGIQIEPPSRRMTLKMLNFIKDEVYGERWEHQAKFDNYTAGFFREVLPDWEHLIEKFDAINPNDSERAEYLRLKKKYEG